jgi:hypothetical protein
MIHRLLIRAGVGLGAMALAGALFASIAWAVAGDAAVRRADVFLHRHERLHFATHLAAGRLLSACPCSRGRADLEYWKAARHAPSARERALVTTERPRRLPDAPRDADRLLRYGAWLTVHDPPTRRVLLLGAPAMALALGAVAAIGWGSARLVYRPRRSSLVEAGPG